MEEKSQAEEPICTVEITVPDSVIYDGREIPYEEYLRMVEDGGGVKDGNDPQDGQRDV